jgi:hypothetical protein
MECMIRTMLTVRRHAMPNRPELSWLEAGRNALFSLLAAFSAIGFWPLPYATAESSADFENRLPRHYVGEFRWIDDPLPQKVQIKINLLRRVDVSRVEAIGCGRYEVLNRVTDIGIQIRIDTPSLDIEIKEFSPSGTGSPVFVTDGSHKGRLVNDLQEIRAEWVTLSSGRRGYLHLRAGSEFKCAGDQAFVRPIKSQPGTAAFV